MATFQDAAEKAKAIGHFPGWTEPEEETGATRFEAPLEIDGIIEAGLFLFGLAFIRAPDCNVVFELTMRNVRGMRRVPLARICWRSLRGGHTNQRNSEIPPGSPKRVGSTHYHPFDLNWVSSDGRMRAGLPNAVPIPERLQSFDDLVKFTGKCFRINNMDIVIRPEWEYELFYERVLWDD